MPKRPSMQSAPQRRHASAAAFPSAAAGLPGATYSAAAQSSNRRTGSSRVDEHPTFRPDIRPSSKARSPRDVADSSASQRAAWLEAQRAAREAALRAEHPFKPYLSPPPGHLSHVRGSFDPEDSSWLAAERAKLAKRRAQGARRAQELAVRCCMLPARPHAAAHVQQRRPRNILQSTSST